MVTRIVSDPRPKRSILSRVLPRLLKLLWTLFVISTPFLGVWGASSLAVFLQGPLWLAIAIGLFLFPLGPLIWDRIAEWRRARRSRDKKRILTFGDRLILRTLLLNLLFIGSLLALFPQRGFEALATRGDWMLEGRKGPQVERVRSYLFAGAELLSGLYEYFHENPFRRPDDVVDDEDPRPSATSKADDARPPPVPTPSSRAKPDGKPPVATRSRSWPLPDTLHPAVVSLPKEHEASIESVAKYLAEKEKDPYFLVKALHDYVADRIAYDGPAYVDYLKKGTRIPPQGAERVFREGIGVCAGYAQLLAALGRAAGIKIVYVGGDSRSSGWDAVRGAGHAWNAAEIDGQWYLIDATWNAGHLSGKKFEKQFGTSYLFTPPEVFLYTHFPDDKKWQLLATPKTRGEFLRLPFLRPEFFGQKLKLLRPDRSQITVAGQVDVEMNNPLRAFVLADSYRLAQREDKTRCDVKGNGEERVRVNCKLAHDGQYVVRLFTSKKRYSTYSSVASLAVNNDL
jgi:transglutaminase-like putative cysteine protease